MPWYRKEHPTPFDTTPLDGLFFLDGNQLQSADFAQHKYPMLDFPSRRSFALMPGSAPDQHRVHLFGEVNVLLTSTRDQALADAEQLAEAVGYAAVRKLGANQLVVVGDGYDEQFLLTYDNTHARLSNVERIQLKSQDRPQHRGHRLMTDELRQQLPPLYSGEKSGAGLDAKAVVKYFHPLSGWIWYAAEFDGKNLFFGLVSGFEVELGYFTLAELQAIGQPHSLPVERDLKYTPQTLRQLLDYHRRHRE